MRSLSASEITKRLAEIQGRHEPAPIAILYGDEGVVRVSRTGLQWDPLRDFNEMQVLADAFRVQVCWSPDGWRAVAVNRGNGDSGCALAHDMLYAIGLAIFDAYEPQPSPMNPYGTLEEEE